MRQFRTRLSVIVTTLLNSDEAYRQFNSLMDELITYLVTAGYGEEAIEKEVTQFCIAYERLADDDDDDDSDDGIMMPATGFV